MFVEFINCSAAQTHDIRQRILRPNQPIEEMNYEGDHDPLTYHCAAIVDGEIVGVASVYNQDLPGRTPRKGWRVRGMAVDEKYRGKRYGLHILGNCISHVKSQEGEYIWCNARKEAVGFYLQEDFEVIGDEFNIDRIGPHYLMIRDLKS